MSARCGTGRSGFLTETTHEERVDQREPFNVKTRTTTNRCQCVPQGMRGYLSEEVRRRCPPSQGRSLLVRL